MNQYGINPELILQAMRKNAVVSAGGGAGGQMDPSMMGGQMDPSMMGGQMDPSMMGGMGMDPSMMGGQMDPSMMGGQMDPSMMGGQMDPSMMGGAAPADPAMAGGAAPADPAAAGGAAAAPQQKMKPEQMMQIIEQRLYNMQQQITAIMNALGIKVDPSALVTPPGGQVQPEAALPVGDSGSQKLGSAVGQQYADTGEESDTPISDRAARLLEMWRAANSNES